MTDWPRSSPIRLATIRASTSVVPPAAAATTRVIDRLGKLSAAAPCAGKTNAAWAAIRALIRRLPVGPDDVRRGHSFLLADADIGPQRLDVLALEHVAPRRHLVLAVGHRTDEAVMLARRKFAQVERAFRILHPRPVTGRTVAGEDFGTGRDLLRWKALALGGCRAQERDGRRKAYSCRWQLHVSLSPASARRSTRIRRAGSS